MPAEFTESGLVHLEREAVAEGLRGFVGAVLRRLDGEDDPRVVRLRENWAAITTADSDEVEFCRAAARLGVDPYRTDEWAAGLSGFLEDGLGSESDRPIAIDLLEASDILKPRDVESVENLWNWVNQARTVHNLRESPADVDFDQGTTGADYPAKRGYRLAEDVRKSLHSGPISSVSKAWRVLVHREMRLEDSNHLQSRTVRAVVGWKGGKKPKPVVVAPLPARKENQRFLEARALYHAAFACHLGPRLITMAHTWDQKASRAFAAELLAPRAELLERVETLESSDDPDRFLQDLADEYEVSRKVVDHQLENAGMDLDAW
jgi:hypothetical protein